MRRHIEISIIIITGLFAASIIVLLPQMGWREEQYHFTKHDSLYFDVYDTLSCYKFKTNTGTDTLIIKEKKVIEDYSKWYFGGTVGSVFNAYFYCEGILIHKGIEEDFYISFKKEFNNQDPTISINIGNLYAMPIKDTRNYVKTGIYNDTIIVDVKNSHRIKLEPNHFIFEYLKWHKYKGIVEYKLSDNTIYKDSI